jgi:hypothetical protein
MVIDRKSRNQALLRFVVLPTIFLSVALLGGLRVAPETHDLIFIAPPLITLILALLLMTLFIRGRLLLLSRWISADHPLTVNASHTLLLLSLFFASAQAINSVLPERGLFKWVFSFCFLWTLWNNQFSSFDGNRLLRSLAVLFGSAFFLKHILLASFHGVDNGGWWQRTVSLLVQGASLGALDTPEFAPATGYISFLTLALYVGGLVLISPSPETKSPERGQILVDEYRRLSSAERLAVCQAIMEMQPTLDEEGETGGRLLDDGS